MTIAKSNTSKVKSKLKLKLLSYVTNKIASRTWPAMSGHSRSKILKMLILYHVKFKQNIFWSNKAIWGHKGSNLNHGEKLLIKFKLVT